MVGIMIHQGDELFLLENHSSQNRWGTRLSESWAEAESWWSLEWRSSLLMGPYPIGSMYAIYGNIM